MKRLTEWLYPTLAAGAVFLVSALLGMAQAQDALPALDPKDWGANPFKLGAVVLFVTASLKRAADRKGWTLKAYLWWSISLTLGILGAAALNLLGYGATLGTLTFPWATIIFGAVAGLMASGFRDLAKTVSDWFQRPATLPAATVGEVLPPAGLIQPARVSGDEALR